MKETPLLMKGPLVCATLKDRKTQTRRLNGLVEVNQNPNAWTLHSIGDLNYMTRPQSKGKFGAYFHAERTIDPAALLICPVICPYGRPGDRLWVRETWATDFQENFLYRATDESPSPMGPYGAKKIVDGVPNIWRPSIFMPRRASRINLEITAIRVERLQQITEADAIAEGIQLPDDPRMFADEPVTRYSAAAQFQGLWNEINGKRAPWASNPWLWVIEFKRAL